jgi:hypothetical protein
MQAWCGLAHACDTPSTALAATEHLSATTIVVVRALAPVLFTPLSGVSRTSVSRAMEPRAGVPSMPTAVVFNCTIQASR